MISISAIPSHKQVCTINRVHKNMTAGPMDGNL